MSVLKKMSLALSVLACALPVFAQSGNPGSKTYSRVIIENCHEERTDLRIWVSRNGGNWRDHGLLETQYSGSGCPAAGQPKTIELEKGGYWIIKALDSRCGSSKPLHSLPRCHVFTTPKIFGDAATAEVYSARIVAEG